MAKSQIGIYDENDRLRAATLWGAIGAEAVLTQLYPPEISLFLENMDVVRARAESRNFITTLEQHGVKVYLARDVLANKLRPVSIDKKTVIDILIRHAEDIKEKYATTTHINYKEQIEELVEEDIKRYGADRALTLNWHINLLPPLPLGNLLFARDQMNVLLNKRVQSSMKKTIRKHEIPVYELVYSVLNVSSEVISIPAGEHFEGGDAYIHDKTIYIGVGPRTSRGAVLHIFKELQREIEKEEYIMILVEDKFFHKRSLTEQMLYMHLDTFSNPLGKKQIAVCMEEADQRMVAEVVCQNNSIEICELNKTFLGYLMENGEEIVEIPSREQQAFGCNFLCLDDTTIFLPLETNEVTIDGLTKIGKKIEHVHLDECTKGYGAAHCMTGQLLRM